MATVSVPLCVCDKIVLQILHLLFPDVISFDRLAAEESKVNIPRGPLQANKGSVINVHTKQKVGLLTSTSLSQHFLPLVSGMIGF